MGTHKQTWLSATVNFCLILSLQLLGATAVAPSPRVVTYLAWDEEVAAEAAVAVAAAAAAAVPCNGREERARSDGDGGKKEQAPDGNAELVVVHVLTLLEHLVGDALDGDRRRLLQRSDRLAQLLLQP